MGLDLAKNTFLLVGLNARGQEVMKKRLSRAQVLKHFANTPRATVAMGASASSLHFARELTRLGHEARLIPPQYVKAYLRGQKNDYNDARAIAEAARVPQMRWVAVKTVDQQDLQALTRLREGVLRSRTALIKTLTAELKAAAKEDDAAQHLQTIPGFGPILTTVFAGALGTGNQYRRGRDTAAAVELTPR